MRPCWASGLLYLVIAALGAGALLSGCGQDGRLYLPDRQDEGKQQEHP